MRRRPDGIDRVEFWVQTNPGTRPGPLMKVASGGELARFLLALKVVLADRGSAPTLVFDEIDTGVGGAVADAIGARLARLAGKVQVVAVTHAPQVAARADRHYVITKDALDARQTRRDPRHRGRGRAPPRGDRPHAGGRRDHRRGAHGRRAADQGGGVTAVAMAQRRHPKHRRRTALTEKQAKAEHARLHAEIAEHDKRYYQDDAPTVSDAEYDALRQRYGAIEAALSRSAHAGKPDPEGRRRADRALRQGAARGADAVARQRLLATRTSREFVDRIRRFLKLAEDEPLVFTAEPKIDGLSMSLRYEDGKLVTARRAATARRARTSPPTSGR